MNCPRCGALALASSPACAQCGFSLPALIAACGVDLMELPPLTDRAHCLRLQEAREVEAALQEFQEHFPQVFFFVYIAVLPQHLSVSEVAFLLLNRGGFPGTDHRRLNEQAVALVLDPVARNVALMAGYALEKWLP